MLIWRTAHFVFFLIDFQLNADFPSNFAGFFNHKIPSVTQRLVSQENAFKKSEKPNAFFPRKTIGSNNYFTLIENNFRFLR